MIDDQILRGYEDRMGMLVGTGLVHSVGAVFVDGKRVNEEDLIIRANQDGVSAFLKHQQCKLAPYVQDGEWRWAPDQIERYRRRKKYRKAFQRRADSGFRNRSKLIRPAGRWIRRVDHGVQKH